MLTLTPEALKHAHEKGGSLYLEYIVVQGCCIHYQPGPTIRFGTPHAPEKYWKEIIEGVTIYIPYDLPDVPLAINLDTFIGFKRLIIEGWRHA
jgi:hypothetical protein